MTIADLHAIGDAESLASASTAARQPSGFTPPALVMMRMPRCTHDGQHVAQMREKVGRIARVGIARALLLQDRHRDFGEVVHHQVVDGPAFHLPARARSGSSPQNPPQLAMIDPLHLNNSRAITIRCTSDVPSPISHSFASR